MHELNVDHGIKMAFGFNFHYAFIMGGRLCNLMKIFVILWECLRVKLMID